MRQVCNISFVAQVESKVEPGSLERFEAELNHPPPGYARTGRSFVTPQLDDLMRPPGGGA